MPKTIYYVSYNLKKGTAAADFLQASKALNDVYMSKQPGYVSWQQLNDGDLWVDMATFETMDDAMNVSKGAGMTDEFRSFAEAFYACINLNTCTQHFFTVEGDYK